MIADVADHAVNLVGRGRYLVPGGAVPDDAGALSKLSPTENSRCATSPANWDITSSSKAGRPPWHTQAPGNGLAGDIAVQLRDPQLPRWGMARAGVVGRDYADQATRIVGQRRGLDRSKPAAAMPRCGAKAASALTSATTVWAHACAALPHAGMPSFTTAK